MKAHTVIYLFLCASLYSILVSASATERELIRDNHFQSGFILWKTEPGQHLSYGELKGFDTNAAPVWGLSQWSSKFPLDPSTAMRGAYSLSCSNAAKGIALTKNAGLAMAVNTLPEYGPKARTASDPWVHLLVEQEFEPPASLAKITSAKLHVEARLQRSRNLHSGDYTPDVHAAQFQIFFTVQNRNHQSSGYGDLLWFGVPIYDNRDRFPKAFKAQDFGGTAKFIFTPGGETFTSQSTHDGKWVVIDKDLLPLMREALETAWMRGFLKGSKDFNDFAIGGMNMGWELPGTFDVEMQVRGLSLKTNP
jgi:hypothetical protein